MPHFLCPNVLADGSCNTPDCRYMHEAFSCEACSMVFGTTILLHAHLASKRHRRRVENQRQFPAFCSMCPDVGVPSEEAWKSHLYGIRHAKQAKKLNQHPTTASPVPKPPSPEEFCDICQVVIGKGARARATHNTNNRHLRCVAFRKYNMARASAEADKNGIELQGDAGDLGVVDPATAQAGMHITFRVQASSPNATTTLRECRLVSAQNRKSTAFSATIDGANRQPTSHHSIDVKVWFRQQYLGRHEDRLELSFEDIQLQKQFIIARSLKAIVGDQKSYKDLMPISPYIPRIREPPPPILEIVDGQRPPALNAIPYVVKLPLAKIPTPLHEFLSSFEPFKWKMHIAELQDIFLPDNLGGSTYLHHFRNLIWIEEYQMICDMDSYNLSKVSLDPERSSGLFNLNVPGLAEKRPSVLVGDQILVQVHGSHGGKWFNGHVHVVKLNVVGLRFHHSFNAIPKGAKFDVRFRINRIPLQRQHQALATVFLEDRALFPLDAGPARTVPSITFYNKLIAANAAQALAVQQIVSLPPGSPPFIIFGPPGTGKTITVVEAIVQILNTQPTARIFACAPSNSAADLVASRLKVCLGDSAQQGLFRFVAPSRSKEQIPTDLIAHTHSANGLFTVPGLDVLKRYRVVVSTCLSASFASNIGLERGHFTHIFVDEAGQATEPETMVSIKTIADQRTNIVLSGDPKQLGPTVRSQIARELDLELSYLERLMQRGAYALPACSGISVVKLVKNFRSHQAILKYPNEKFYDGELEACADPTIRNRYLNSDYLPSTGKMFPLVFHSITGLDTREGSSPSFFNIEEVLQVREYVQRLKAHRKIRTTDDDIGVISPYHAQCVKLRKHLKDIAPKVKVGSVEEFQGQERSVVIISTVRSNKKYTEHDVKHSLGFVSSPRRFNVAVTRAKSLLIVVGDPNTLGADPLWREFLNYVYINGGWTGPEISWDPEAPVDPEGRFDELLAPSPRATFEMEVEMKRLGIVTTEGGQDIDVNVDRPWVTEE